MISRHARILLMMVVLLVSLSLCGSAAPIPESWSNPPSAADLGLAEFNEAPSLRELVEKGELPPVADRLPVIEDILVIEPVEEIGVYGGSAVSFDINPNSYASISHPRIPFMFYTDKSASTVIGDIARNYELKNNNTELIIYLRKGLKWSDGYPFTVDDILFWWNDEVNNEDINHWAQSYWTIRGEKADFQKIDDYTLKIVFPQPNPTILSVINYWPTQQGFFFDPAHYMKQFHKKYNPDIVGVAKDKGYETWVQYFEYMKEVGPGQQNPELPVVGPWMLEKRDSTQKVFVRNPYYYAVDPEGNQLPYLDRLVLKIVSELEVGRLDALQGDIDFTSSLEVTDYAMYKKNEAQGNYRIYNWRNNEASTVAFAFNQNCPDAVKAGIFQDVRFRRAMSLAINREEINQFLYMGMAVPSQVTVDPNTSYYEEWWAESYADYDPKAARQLLDEMGLKKDQDGFYLRPDGKALSVDLFARAEYMPVCELVKTYWEDVGVKVNLKTIARELYETRVQASQHDVGVWPVDRMLELRVYSRGTSKYEMGTTSEFGYAIEWDRWYKHKMWEDMGRQGEEPPAGIKPPEEIIELLETMEAWYLAGSDEEYRGLGKKIWSFHAENLYIIGTVARPMQPVLIHNSLCNVAEEAPLSDATSFWKIVYPVQWFKK